MCLAFGLGLGPGAGAAQAHLVVGSKTVRELTEAADLVVRARVVARHEVAGRSTAELGRERPAVEAEVLEVLKGDADTPRVRFVQHGHGVATFEPGREHLVFLLEITRSRELGALGSAGAERWVSLQEHEDAFPLGGPESGALLAATRDYVRAGAANAAEPAGALLRTATLQLLTSGDTRLASSALRDLVAAPSLRLITPDARLVLEGVVDDAGTSMGVRVALLVQLEARGLVDGTSRWLAWLADDAPTPDLVAAIRAAGNDPRLPVRERVMALLASERAEVAAEAARALGRPGDSAAVEPLSRALVHSSSRVRHAAIRGLGRTGTPAAIDVLEKAGEGHPDAATRRLARAEARKQKARTSGAGD